MSVEPLSVTGVTQHYAWGDTTFIPELLGEEVDGRPHAELWLGTHPNGPTTLDDGRSLRDVTGELPYLLKVLAAARPLSLQVHPTTEQAIDGFARGIYPDDRAKPELLCALTQFDALCGIRPVHATLAFLDELDALDLSAVIRSDGLAATIERLYRGQLDPLPTVRACETSDRVEASLVTELAATYPDDPSIVVTLLMNRITLQPGQALHLTAGNLHAYLRGAGIELMGASDNVVRGGMTSKHVDVDELLRILDPTPLPQPVMSVKDGRYPLPEAGCILIRLEPGDVHTSAGHELTVSLTGETTYLPSGATLAPATTTFVVTTDSP
ncbi:MAG: mannose-6-phosphate isomerase, class I [Ilumatobacteraceae bacterium]